MDIDSIAEKKHQHAASIQKIKKEQEAQDRAARLRPVVEAMQQAVDQWLEHSPGLVFDYWQPWSVDSDTFNLASQRVVLPTGKTHKVVLDNFLYYQDWCCLRWRYVTYRIVTV
jgi:hypothetical protein